MDGAAPKGRSGATWLYLGGFSVVSIDSPVYDSFSSGGCHRRFLRVIYPLYSLALPLLRWTYFLYVLIFDLVASLIFVCFHILT